MLTVQPTKGGADDTWLQVAPGQVLTGLMEDRDYLLRIEGRLHARVLVDDVELRQERGEDFFRWCPSFYAGRVTVEVLSDRKAAWTRDAGEDRYFLDVSPSAAKSGQAEFEEMVSDIRAEDASLLLGQSAATFAFGQRADFETPFVDDVRLARIREHGPGFLSAVESIVSAPHRSLVAESRRLPLTHIRRLHPSALRDRCLAAVAAGQSPGGEAVDRLQLTAFTSAPTFDTPANRALLSLLKRFLATVRRLRATVEAMKLGGQPEEQAERVKRRVEVLALLDSRASRLIAGTVFAEVGSSGNSAAGLTQISAQPLYGRAYRLGCRALADAIDDDNTGDRLHVPPSWGIYETWCYLAVLRTISRMLGGPLPGQHPSCIARADRCVVFPVAGGATCEVLMQATFPALKPTAGRSARSISRERRPDILVALVQHDGIRYFIFDAKWRHGRQAVLESMESAHIYHDSLRVTSAAPDCCLLLLPGEPSVAELEGSDYVAAHGVGAVSGVRVGGAGQGRLDACLRSWLADAAENGQSVGANEAALFASASARFS